MIQNSIIHGKSNQVSIFFDRNIIKYKDNCSFHDINKETVKKGGGKTSWEYFKKNYVDTQVVSYRYDEYKYQFIFNNIEILENIPDECKLDYELPKKPNDKCEITLLDFSNYRMGSLNPCLFIVCKDLIKAGKLIYVKIDNQIQITMLEEITSGYPELIKFYY